MSVLPAAIVALLALGVATLPLPHYAAAVAATAVVLAVAVADGRRAAREESESPK
ncbi:hypothetical protein P9209_01480 [Prescottella defluvii]|nr:hypothetical protein P9209_01480 [Prescottella defluvii]